MTDTLQSLLKIAEQQLKAVTDSAKLEAEILLSYVLEKPRSYLHAWSDKSITATQLNQFMQLLNRRLQQEPVAYLTGNREFWSLELCVTKDTLIPRPETEILVEEALVLGEKKAPLKVADLGTGCGAIALALAKERPDWHIFAVDISQNALQIASKNAQKFGLSNISFHLGSWCTALPHLDLDMIISNPPYIAETEWEVYANGLVFEPRNALVSGMDGLDALRHISREAACYLKPGGYLLLEHGFSQGKAVSNLMVQAGFHAIRLIRDQSGLERVTIAVR